MSTARNRKHPLLPAKVQVNSRLYRSDVDLLRGEARRRDIPWQALLRALVHDAMRKKVATLR